MWSGNSEVIFGRQTLYKRALKICTRTPGVARECCQVWGNFGGPCACGATFSYYLPLPNFFVSLLLSKTTLQKEGLKNDNPARLGAGGPRFKSGRADQNIFCFVKCLAKPRFASTASVENGQAGVQVSHVVQRQNARSSGFWARVQSGLAPAENTAKMRNF